jgi:hypothetical protein
MYIKRKKKRPAIDGQSWGVLYGGGDMKIGVFRNPRRFIDRPLENDSLDRA